MEWLIVAIPVIVIINACFAALMRGVAVSKGYLKSPVFALVFLFGIFGVLYVIALPDLVARQQQKNILDVLYAINRHQEKTNAPESASISKEAIEALNDIIKPNNVE